MVQLACPLHRFGVCVVAYSGPLTLQNLLLVDHFGLSHPSSECGLAYLLDTRTGQICRTWDWSPYNSGKMNASTGATPGGEIRRICAYLLLPVPALSNENESSFRTYQIRRRRGVRFADWADLPELRLDTYNAWKTGRKQECAGSKIRRIHANLRDQHKSG